MSDLCLAVPMEDGNKKEKRVSVSISLTDSEREFKKRESGGLSMGCSATQRIKQVKQPRGG